MTTHLWAEGAHHPFEEIAPELRIQLEQATGGTVQLVTAEQLGHEPCDLLVMAGLLYSGVEGYQPLSAKQKEALLDHTREGKPSLGLHCVIGSFDEWPEAVELFDGLWDWSKSKHSPVEEFAVAPIPGAHPAVEGLEPFHVVDELYYDLVYPKGSVVAMTARYQGEDWPLAWFAERGAAKIGFLGLGHDLRSIQNPGYRRLLRQSVAWLLS